MSTDDVLKEVATERERQEARFPEQHLPLGTNELLSIVADEVKKRVNQASGDGTLTWMDVLYEEFCEVQCEENPSRLRNELIQVAAVAVRIVEDIDRETR